MAIFVTIFFGLLGWVDDLLKIKFNSSKGLSAPSKIFWQSIITLIAVSFFSGIILSTIGIIGVYIARIYEQIQGRPRYIIRNIIF